MTAEFDTYFISTVSNNSKTSKKKNIITCLIVGIIVSIGLVIFLFVFAIFCIVQRRKRPSSIDDEELRGIYARLYIFSYTKLKIAKRDFSPANKLSEGGFRPVYKHCNLIKLYGCYIEEAERLLVYECLESNNLNQALFEYTMYEHIIEKIELFDFGVTTGDRYWRPNSDSSFGEEQIYLHEWQKYWKIGNKMLLLIPRETMTG
ncbi:hypothetical protein Ddye_005585 [Dipteronia dyeriana]|uniref:Uncharacterized protein n=1 Tax=Dipteronia dyeriana TaxID=168575 RepID=A0AAE0CPU5_9ROSI|nr:hypothetical protein Ddye_005585 [Dipteronia dyeriana]